MNLVDEILQELQNGNTKLAYASTPQLNEMALNILDIKDHLDSNSVDILGKIIRISHIVYNDTDNDILPISDGVYDHLVELYKIYNPDYNVGADVIHFNNTEMKQVIVFNDVETQQKQAIFFDDSLGNKINNGFFADEIMFPDYRLRYEDIVPFEEDINMEYMSKRFHDTEHNHPELVGTLGKCKFVTCKEAAERGVLNDSNVKILERDFFAEHIKNGIIDPTKVYTMCLELKYDGVSIEADCANTIISARSRGDTGIGKASDMSPLLAGYRFPHVTEDIIPIGIKYEAIIMKDDLLKYNQLKGYNYKNCRSAIVGLTSSSDGYKYRDLITLVPLQVDNEYKKNCPNRISEIEFLNDYFATHGCPLRYCVIGGTYIELLFQIKLFLEESDFYRNYLPFMYDGIVVSYVDEDVREKLGRENSINKYSIAVKFEALKVQTIFRGYKYTVGQDGSITPMIYYDPVEFYGTIHPKSSGHSYNRFNELNLSIGDIIDVSYMNDVMPYVSKPFNIYNESNINPPERFPTECPVCGYELIVSSSGKSVKCTNQTCGGRAIARMVNMFGKLNVAEFGNATIEKIGKYHIKDIFDIYYANGFESYGFGPGESLQLMNNIQYLETNQINDYQIIGSLGFTNLGRTIWKLIFNKMTPEEFMGHMDSNNPELILKDMLLQIKGIGATSVNTILTEYPFFRDDMIYCLSKLNIKRTKGVFLGKQIRATGFRNKELFGQLQDMGYDADDNKGVTKQTSILLIPYEGYSEGSKMKKVSTTCIIIPVEEFISNMHFYL